MRQVSIGEQSFSDLRKYDSFYVDKTRFLKEWWDGRSKVTLITRPRRFGKTLTMSMVESFFSVQYAGQGEIFEGLEVWEEKEFMKLQGTYPVISLSFANVKETHFNDAREKICLLLTNLYARYFFLRDSDVLTDKDRDYFDRVSMDMSDSVATMALYQLSDYLHRYYGKKVIILLDEYDAPMQEAYLNGYWKEMVAFARSLFSAAFKDNPWVERGIITGITRISKESLFSDLNNLKVITTSSNKYADIFGFTRQEVFSAMDEMGLKDRDAVEQWYDGYVIGEMKGIYNPWSVINYLDEKKIDTYWANTSSNSLVSKLIQEGSSGVKKNVESLLRGQSILVSIDEEIVFSQLDKDEDAVWSLLLSAGYLKVVQKESVLHAMRKKAKYELELTNMEIRVLFKDIVFGWFHGESVAYHGFIGALLAGDVEEMNEYLNEISEKTFSYFDTQQREPEKFYHGFVLGLLVEMEKDYILTSNRESGKGRYDVVIEPREKGKDAFIIEFKAVKQGQNLGDAVESALAQIEEKQYGQDLLAKGFAKGKIRQYGFAFKGKKVLIGRKTP